MFDEMGFIYLGPVDGHDIGKMTYLLQQARELACPVLLHVTTTKGRGYSYAEESPDEYHGVSSFDVASGASNGSHKETFSSAFGKTMCAMASEDHRICAVTAAMEQGTGLSEFAESYPKRFFDVGIAEGHAVTMSCGMAKQGMLPVVAVYSTFLQRAYDMLIHDAALGNLHVVFAVDRAGLVGADGETHHGAFDVGFLRSVPGMSVFAPSSTEELRKTLHHAVYETDGPVAVRYPRGGNGVYQDCILEDAILSAGQHLTIVTYGTMVSEALWAAGRLEKQGIEPEIVKLWSIKPLNMDLIEASVRKTGHLLVLEDCVEQGCVGQEILSRLEDNGISVQSAKLLNFGNQFVTHGTIPELYHLLRLDAESIEKTAKELCHVEKRTT